MRSMKEIHPVVSLFFFISVLSVTMFFSNPYYAFSSMLGALIFLVCLNKNITKELFFYLAIITVVSVTNPLFSHRGTTPLFFINNNPITLEAFFYGVNLGLTMVAVMLWFRCFNLVLTQEKILYLLGRISPKTALLLSNALRYIPLLKVQALKIQQVQKSAGLYTGDSLVDRIRGFTRVFSTLVGWSLENAVETGQSMKARGYGLKGRTYFSQNIFRKTDIVLLVVLLFLDFCFCVCALKTDLNVTFYPIVSFPEISVYGVLGMGAFAVLCLVPFVIELRENLGWKYYKSRI